MFLLSHFLKPYFGSNHSGWHLQKPSELIVVDILEMPRTISTTKINKVLIHDIFLYILLDCAKTLGFGGTAKHHQNLSRI